MLDMYRQEALAARQESTYGAMLDARPFLFRGGATLVMAIATLLMVVLMVERTPRVMKVQVTLVAGMPADAQAIDLVVTSPVFAPSNGQRVVLRSGVRSIAPMSGVVSYRKPGQPLHLQFSVDHADRDRVREAMQAGAQLNLEWQLPEQAFGQWLLAAAWQRSAAR